MSFVSPVEIDHLYEKLSDKIPGLQKQVPLSRHNWFRVGGYAALFLDVQSEEALSNALKGVPDWLPVTVLGGGSNTLVRDGGVNGLVIRMGKEMASLERSGESVIAGAGLPDIRLARMSAEEGLAGFEFLIGIPGSLGGAIATNAGAHGHEIAEQFIEASAIDRQGNFHTLSPADFTFAYRQSGLPKSLMITRVSLKGVPSSSEAVTKLMDENQKARDLAQPTGLRTGGSTFKNPSGSKAWELIEKAGCRDLVLGGASMSSKHCNFMVNNGKATASDLEVLGEQIRERVLRRTGVLLQWEIERIGQPKTMGARS